MAKDTTTPIHKPLPKVTAVAARKSKIGISKSHFRPGKCSVAEEG
jgi:hypothetical protein